SGDHNDLLKQAELLSETSREIVLTGIHTGRYNDGSYDLYRLLKELVKIEGLETIRLSSIEITEISDEIISLMKDNEKIAHHLHIPLQAGTDEILKAMNRPYTLEEYIDRVEYIRRQIPDISISTDLICGFPGESEELFEKTLRTIERIRFSFIHCFPYARKKGTVADGMSGHLNNDVKKERVNRVLSFQKGITEEFNRSFIGKKLRLLVEKKDEDYVYGYVRQYFYVKAKGDAQIGDLCDVIITAVNEEGVEGYVA
ncbi:MAG: radical SAM protein, partial [Erysipelotrichaceae bacterium]|nr:radical SAM protein [Erysipelotrichaceae bacterium]